MACTLITSMLEPVQTTSGPQIIQWLLDTRPLWPISSQAEMRNEIQALKAAASRTFALISEEEQSSVLKYYHIRDAKMCLGSYLLKHLVISQYLQAPWSECAISRDSNGKPCYAPFGQQRRIDFNVSHQAGIVSLIAAVGFDPDVRVGTDVVCVDERRQADYRHIEKEGFFDWVDMHGDVFADSELSHMRLGPLGLEDIGIHVEDYGSHLDLRGYGQDVLARCQRRNEKLSLKTRAAKNDEIQIESNVVIDAKLRRFYAMWCLREAYVKMTGEALLAPWLKDLEIVKIKAPRAKEGAAQLEEGEHIKGFVIHFRKQGEAVATKVNDVQMELVALGPNFMVAAAIRLPKSMQQSGVEMGKWKVLDLEKDVLEIAEAASSNSGSYRNMQI